MTGASTTGRLDIPAIRTYPSEHLLDALVRGGYRRITGVPCSLFGDLFSRAMDREDLSFMPAAREDLAVGVAVGAALAGDPTAVFMQNSAVGMILNATQSLAELYAVPVLLVISWRGEGQDAPEHLAMGERMFDILDRAGIPVRLAADVVGGKAPIPDTAGPVALVVRRGEVVKR